MASACRRILLRGARGLLLLTIAAGAIACRSTPAPGARPLLLVGVDAADWLALDPLIEQGLLPAFARLRRAGKTGVLIAEPPLLSPILWTTIATGRPPEEHGVLDFMVDAAGGGQAPVGSASRRVPALWNAFSDAGRTVCVVGWWATWPAETLRGVVVSDRVAPQLMKPGPLDNHAIAPAAAAERLRPLLVRAETVENADLRERVPASEAELRVARAGLASPSRSYDDPLAHLAAVVAGTRSYTAMAEELLRRDRPALLAVYFEAVDSISHRFVRDPRGASAIAAAYADVDAALLRLARAAPPETWVVVVSDHGFASPSAGIVEDPADLAGPASAWHRPYGMVGAIEAGSLAGGTVGTGGTRVAAVTPLDIAPTVMHAAGLAVGDRMPGRVALDLVPAEAASRPVARARLLERGPEVFAAAPAADPDAVARLRALGYVGASGTSLGRQNLGEILYRKGRLEDAERELRAVVLAQPNNLAARLWLARALSDQGRKREALEAYRAALPLPGATRDALVPAVELALATAGPAAAQHLLDAVPTSERAMAPALVARSLIARAGGKRVEADRLLRAALAVDALDFDALSRLLESAAPGDLPYFERAAARAPDSPRHLALLGAALRAAGRAGEARSALARALSLAPDGDSVRLELARVQITEQDVDAALLTLAPARPAAAVATLRGVAFSLQKRWPEAAQAYREAVDLTSPPAPELLNGLAWAELQQGRSAEARALFDRSLLLRPEQPHIRSLRDGIGAGS